MRAILDETFELDDDPRRVDRARLWRFLSTEAYWGRWRSESDVVRQLDSAWRVVAAYERATGEMVGFSRAISDGVAYGYLADVYVEAPFRGRGLGVAIVNEMIAGSPPTIHWLLHTRDAQPLYATFGFAPPSERLLERPPGAR